ncbi:MAG TPA: UDP-N-acetylmuramoyl-L-alanine--D-glutamate ligase [Ilumatobacteraceae bacterium]
MPSALVYGVAIAGEAVMRSLRQRGYEVVAADDTVTAKKQAIADALGVVLHSAPDEDLIEQLVSACDFVAPAPGVSETHAVVRAALRLGRPLRTEIDLAYEWEQSRPSGARPMLAITGTDGKTTTTFLATEMLRAAGLNAVAVGNTEIPLVAVIDDDSIDVFVVECTSFRLSWTTCFRPHSAVWLNLAPDHLNWHVNMASYEAAKARMWMYQRADDIAIGFAADPTVMRRLDAAPGRHVTFGLTGADYHCRPPVGSGATLMGPLGPICSVAAMRRSLPHDITNALAAAALVQQAGLAGADAISTAIQTFVGPPHRIEPVGEAAGVRWYNDSKATTPHAALTAIRAFDSLVLIAGGRNKGLDLHGLSSEPQRMRGVVAIGEAAPEIAAVFAGVCEVRSATSMTAAVDAAAAMAEAGDAVVLSPACASFDWYPDGGYPARGDDFRAIVARHLAAAERTST